MYKTKKLKRGQIYIGREYQKDILSCVGSAKIFNVIRKFPELDIDILKEGIIYPLSYNSRSFKWIKRFINNLHKYVNQIDARTYVGYMIIENYFSQNCPFQKSTENRLTCASSF